MHMSVACCDSKPNWLSVMATNGQMQGKM